MKFAAVHRAFLLSGRAVDAQLVALGAWVRLQSYCSSDGIESPSIPDSADWTDRQWLSRAQLLAVDVAAVVSAGLARWVGEDLFVEGFDADGLRVIEAKRAAGRYGHLGKRTNPEAPPEPHPQGEPMGDPEATPSPLLTSPLLTSPLHKATAKPAAGSGLTLVRQITTARGRKARSQTPVSAAFEAFWAVWPVKIKKVDAYRAWRESGCDEPGKAEDVTAAARAQRPFFDTRPRDKVPHAATWLNGARWTDEVIAPDVSPRPGTREPGPEYEPLIERKAGNP